MGVAAASAACIALLGAAAPSTAQSVAPQDGAGTISATGLRPGQIKHVWLIILENKSYDATSRA